MSSSSQRNRYAIEKVSVSVQNELVENLKHELALRISSIPKLSQTFQGSTVWQRCSYEALGCHAIISESNWMNHHLCDCHYRPLVCDFLGIFDTDHCELVEMDAFLSHLKLEHGIFGFDFNVELDNDKSDDKSVSFMVDYDKSIHFMTSKPFPIFYMKYNSRQFVVFTKWDNVQCNICWCVKMLGSQEEANSYSADIKIKHCGLNENETLKAKFSVKVLSVRERSKPWANPGSHCACLTIPDYNQGMNLMDEGKNFTITVYLKYNLPVPDIRRSVVNMEESQENKDEESESES